MTLYYACNTRHHKLWSAIISCTWAMWLEKYFTSILSWYGPFVSCCVIFFLSKILIRKMFCCMDEGNSNCWIMLHRFSELAGHSICNYGDSRVLRVREGGRCAHKPLFPSHFGACVCGGSSLVCCPCSSIFWTNQLSVGGPPCHRWRLHNSFIGFQHCLSHQQSSRGCTPVFLSYPSMIYETFVRILHHNSSTHTTKK